MSEEENKNKNGFMSFLGVSQSTYINQIFNQAVWKCLNFYHEEYFKQQKQGISPIAIKDYFGSDNLVESNQLAQFENHCIVKMKEYADQNFSKENKMYIDCRKECEQLNTPSGKVMGFIKNERCFKRCRNEFDSENKDKVNDVFSRFLPQLENAKRVNRRIELKRDEEKKIQEIQAEFGEDKK